MLCLQTVGGASTGLAEEAEFDPNDSGNWSKFLKTMRDPEKQRKKDERRKQKEEVNVLNTCLLMDMPCRLF